MDLEMDLKYINFLDEWGTNPGIKCVLVESSSPWAFSAGNYLQVFAAEYSLICRISDYKRPYICFMDGATMGFGIGLSVMVDTILSQRGLFSQCQRMELTCFQMLALLILQQWSRKRSGWTFLGIVFFFYQLSSVRVLILEWLGKKITSPADALYMSLGTHYVPSGSLATLKEALLNINFTDDPDKDVQALLAGYKKEPESEPLLKMLLPITSCFGNGSVSETIEELKRHQASSDSVVADWANDALLGLGKGAPVSLCITQKHGKPFIQTKWCNED